MNKRAGLWAHVLLIFVTLIWGSTFSLVKLALRDATPLAFNLVRMTLAALLLAAFNFQTLRQATQADLKLGALAGFFLGIGYQLQTAGLRYTSAAKSGILTGLIVLFVPLLTTIPALRTAKSTKPGPAVFLGALLAFVGLFLLTAPAGSGFALFSGIGLGEALTLGCALVYSGHLLTLDRAASTMPARRLGTLQIIFCAATMLVTLPLGGHPSIRFTPVVLVALAVTAVLATAFAFIVQSWTQQHLPATHTAIILTTEPVFAWLFALLFLGEHLGPRAALGAVLILAGIAAAELGPTLRGAPAISPTGE